MLAGRRPFAGSTNLGVITSILRDQPPPLRTSRPGVPAGVDAIVERALAKDPASRYQDAAALATDLAAVQARLTRPPDVFWRKPMVIIPVALLLLVVAGFGVWQMVQARRVRWAREAIPEIERLQNAAQNLSAYRLARSAERSAAAEIARVRQGWYPLRLSTNPEGADVQIKDYLDINGSWEPMGQTPLDGRLPLGYYRVRITKAGYGPIEFATSTGRSGRITLALEQDVKPGMVSIAGGAFSVGISVPVQLPEFWMAQLEVTNQEYKRFVDAGGYRNPEYWKEPFYDGDRTLSFDEAVARFRDATGRTGPASWELGTYPTGKEHFPVGGISWFEANAYAAFAGKTLPTIYHWYRAAPREEISSEILQLSNFDGSGPTRAGERQGLGPWGTLDMAGNVKEWCANAVEGTPLRYILGGAWNEPHYRYSEEDAHSPWDRRPTFGMRVIESRAATPDAARPVARLTGDPKSVVPVSGELFEVYRRFYSYDRTPLNARVESVDDSSEYWRRETVSFDAAYAGERVPAHLFLPKNAQPPYQAVIVFPSRYAVNAGTSQNLDYSRFDFIVRSGRAVLYPIYQGTYERRRADADAPVRKEAIDAPQRLRDLHVQWAKDFFRATDYLETRKEIDHARLAYYSLSMGAFFGPIPVALEPRIKAAVFLSGGLRFNFPPEIHPANFMPHVKVPVLLINGRDDFQVPIDHQKRFFELLGTPSDSKRHVALDGGHVPVDNLGVIREVLDWFDKYLGPVK